MLTRSDILQLLPLMRCFSFVTCTLKPTTTISARICITKLRPYRHVFRALPSTIGGIIWFSMMLYFLIMYETLPRLSDGNLPRIGLVYAVFPYISSIGALHISAFQTCAILVAIFMSIGFGVDYYFGQYLRPGLWFRRAKLAAALIASVFLVALTFENVNDPESHLHLIFTSIQIFGIGLAKFFGFIQNHSLLKVAPDVRFLMIGQRYRTAVAVFAIPASVITIIGIYGCQGPTGELPKSAICFKIVTVSAPAEWLLSISWILFLFTVTYDNYHAEETRAIIVFRYPHTAIKLKMRESELDLISQSGWAESDELMRRRNATPSISISERESLFEASNHASHRTHELPPIKRFSNFSQDIAEACPDWLKDEEREFV